MSKEITPRATDYSEWYTDIVRKANMADYSAVKGCMVIKPHGFAIAAVVWRFRLQHNIQKPLSPSAANSTK